MSSLLPTALLTTLTATVALDASHRVLTNPTTGALTYPLIPHSVHLARRRLQLPNDRPTQSRHSSRHLQQQMGALYQGYGTHYVDLWLGSPTPRRQTVIVDTGSGVTAFPCEECTDCGDHYHTDSYYKHSLSETFRAATCDECQRGFCASMMGLGEKKCKFSMSYAEGSSWTAYESLDVCYAGGPHDVALASSQYDEIDTDHIDPVLASQFAFELDFGCQVSITGLFVTQLADGIMGMEDVPNAFWKQMYEKKVIPKPEFSLCFSRQDNPQREGTGAGALTFGGVDPRLHTTPMVFASNTRPDGFYTVHVKAIYLREGGGNSAQMEDMSKMHRLDADEALLNKGNVIVDSGTTDTYFTRELSSAFNSAWKTIMGNAYNHNPVTLTQADIDQLPTIIIVLQGHEGGVGDEVDTDPNAVPGYAGDVFGEFEPTDVVLAIPGSHYMEYDPDTNKYVARFYTDEGSGSVLGANAMMGHDIYFDIANHRIGFAESDCDYNALLMQEGKSISVAPEQVVNTKADVSGYNDDNEEEGYEDDAEYEYDDDADENVKPGRNSGNKGGISTYTEIANEIFDDMKHECSSASCRGVAAFLVLAVASFVLLMIRRTIARRRVVRQYQEAELEISDLALDSDSDDDDGGYEDDPSSLHRIS